MRILKTRATACAVVVEEHASLEGFLGSAKPRKRASAGTRRNDYIAEVRTRMQTKDWTGMTAGKLVALYWLCHERVYGTPPVELNKAKIWEMAMMAAGTMVRDHFDGDVQVAIRFMRWVWTREQSREDWRRKNNTTTGRRISWHNQFKHHYLVTDWRTEKVRRQG